jgi:hypothetical protein
MVCQPQHPGKKYVQQNNSSVSEIQTSENSRLEGKGLTLHGRDTWD